MRVPLSWLREYADLPEHVTATEVAARLTALGLKLESVTAHGVEVKGPLVVGRVRSFDIETHSNGKTIRWCEVDVGREHAAEGGGPRGIVCGAANFAVGDLVVVALPGAVLARGMSIGARETYGHVSDGMVCSARELDLGDDASGVIVLPDTTAEPGADAIPLLHLLDEVIELEITPDRSYALSLRGVAREAATGFGVAFHDPAGIPVTPGDGASYPVRVEDEHDCPVFVTRTVTGFDPQAPTPRWLARRVQLAGMRPISLAVDITNYVMLEFGQPIHGYDRAKLTGAISVRRALSGEELRTLDGADRRLDPEDLVIADESGVIGLAGVMGGEATEISATTTDVVIEAAHFAGVPIARTARRLRLASEASRRFERGVDPLLVRAAAQRVADLLVEHGGGRTQPGETVCGSVPAWPPIVLPVDLPTRVCGVGIDADAVASSLRQVGCEVVPQQGQLTVTRPSWRPDLVDPYDLVEEVLRVVGYDQVPSVLPTAPAGRGLTQGQLLRRRIGAVLAGAGFAEVIAYPFVGPADWDRLGLAADDERRRCVLLAYPLSEQRPELTTSLAPLLLEVLARNIGRGHSAVALSLTAPVFLPDEGPLCPAPILPVDQAPDSAQLAALDEAVPRQPHRLAVILSGDRELAGWWGEARPVLWADAVAAVRLVAAALGVAIDVERDALMPWHPGRCGSIRLAGSLIGHAGELHPRVCRAWDVPARTSYAEVDLDLLIAAAPHRPELPALSAMPVAKEDVALVVDTEVPAAQVEEALRAGAGDLLESLRLFDVYTGEPVPAGKKSLAFSLRFRAPDRTLTEREIAAARDTAVAAAAAATGAVQRT